MTDNQNTHNQKEEIIKKARGLMQLVRQKTLIRNYLEELIKKPKSKQELIKERNDISLDIEKMLKENIKLILWRKILLKVP